MNCCAVIELHGLARVVVSLREVRAERTFAWKQKAELQRAGKLGPQILIEIAATTIRTLIAAPVSQRCLGLLRQSFCPTCDQDICLRHRSSTRSVFITHQLQN